MLSIPTLAQLLTVIGVTLLGTAVLVATLATLFGSDRPAALRRRRAVQPRAAIATVPAQRGHSELIRH